MIPSTFRLLNGTFERSTAALAVRVERFADRALDQLQRTLLEALRPALVNPIMGGNRLSDVVFASGTPIQLPHFLDRAYSGWTITRIRGSAARFIEVAQADELNARYLTIQADANCTADVYVF